MATQPCPGGHCTDPSKKRSTQCRKIEQKLSRNSIPLVSWTDLHIDLPAVKYRKLTNRVKPLPLSARGLLVPVRSTISASFPEGIYANACIKSADISRYCRLDGVGEELRKTELATIGLSARQSI
jgi:magnesium chelatase family protein